MPDSGLGLSQGQAKSLASCDSYSRLAPTASGAGSEEQEEEDELGVGGGGGEGGERVAGGRGRKGDERGGGVQVNCQGVRAALKDEHYTLERTPVTCRQLADEGFGFRLGVADLGLGFTV